jgi:heptosyltransferase-2
MANKFATLLVNIPLSVFLRFQFFTLQTDTRKILVIRMSSIGDIILTTPLVRVLRAMFPEAQIDFLVKKEFSPVIQHNPNVSNVIAFDKAGGFSGLLQLRKKLKGEHYDWCIDLHGSLRSRFLRHTIFFRERSTYSKQVFNRFMLIRFRRNLYREVKPTFMRYFESVEAKGLTYDGKGTELYIPGSSRDKVLALLSAKGFDHEKPLLVICPGAAHTNKQWLPERFVAVADHFASQGVFVVLHGGGKEKELCEGMLKQMKQKAHCLAGQLSLAETAALLGNAACVLTNDSGLMHIAQSQKVPVVAIFGPTTRQLGFFPLPDNSTVIEASLPCRPCTYKGAETCPEKHFDCMNKIRVEDVVRAVEGSVK